jgi:heat shock protein HtpX
MHNHHNGLKTAALFGAIWAVLLGLGALVQGGRFIWIFALIGVATTF